MEGEFSTDNCLFTLKKSENFSYGLIIDEVREYERTNDNNY